MACHHHRVRRGQIARFDSLLEPEVLGANDEDVLGHDDSGATARVCHKVHLLQASVLPLRRELAVLVVEVIGRVKSIIVVPERIWQQSVLLARFEDVFHGDLA